MKSIKTLTFSKGTTTEWMDDLEYNIAFLKHIEKYIYEIIKRNGYITLDRIKDMLGYHRDYKTYCEDYCWVWTAEDIDRFYFHFQQMKDSNKFKIKVTLRDFTDTEEY